MYTSIPSLATGLLSLLSATSILSSTATAAPLSQLHKRASPALAGYNADPNIIVFGDTYYVYPTNDGEDWEGKSFYVWKSKDLVSWTKSAQPILTLDGTNVPWSDGKAWAPGIIERGGKYYFYFSGNYPVTNDLAIGVAVAPTPEGPFTAQPSPLITNREASPIPHAIVSIDPMAYQDPQTGKYYLLWGNGNALIAELNDDMVSLNWDTAREMTGLDGYFEAPFVFFRKGLYHMSWSIDDTRNPTYHVAYATATSLDGPWTNHGTIIEQDPSKGIEGTGHQSFLNVPGTDDWFACYHRFAIPNGDGKHRETVIDRVQFDEQTGVMGKVVVTLEGVEPYPVPRQ